MAHSDAPWQKSRPLAKPKRARRRGTVCVVPQSKQPAPVSRPAQSSEPRPTGSLQDWQSQGTHLFCVQMDVLHWQGHGPMELADIRRMFEERVKVQQQQGRVFLLVDARDMGATSAEARRYAAQYKPESPFRGTVTLLGASLVQRTVVSLVSAAARLLGRDDQDLRSLFFVADEAEAKALIEQHRQQLASTLPVD